VCPALPAPGGKLNRAIGATPRPHKTLSNHDFLLDNLST
jgi:hypothetical protein